MHRAAFQAERIVESIIPDLTDRPVYVISPAMFHADVLQGAGGMYSDHLDVAFQQQLEEANRWRGRGLGVVVNCDQAMANHGDDSDLMIIGAALHELAHWLDRPEPSEPTETPQELFADVETSRADDDPLPSTLTPATFARRRSELGIAASHGEKFTRLATHVWYRCCHSPDGMCLSPHYLAIGNTYAGLESYYPSPSSVIDTLREEFDSTLPLRELAATPPPPAYRKLWQSVWDTMWSREGLIA